MGQPYDIIIAGSGPAGLALAASCVRAGLATAVVSPDADSLWPNGYGVWVDEITDPELDECLSIAWDSVEVRFSETDANLIRRRYGRVDNAALQTTLRARAAGASFERTVGRSVVHDVTGSTLLTDAGSLRGSVVVDATGTGALLETGAPTAFQAAWGEIVDTDDLDPAVPRWMDHTPLPGSAASFLYALPLGGRRWLLEETSLVRTPALEFELLRERLALRLHRYGVRVLARHGVERVRIPMNSPIPRPQRTVGFGAAAGMVHPSTGYLLTRVLRDAPRLAAALAGGLRDSPEAASNAAWAELWPIPRVRQRALHLYGAEVVAGLDPAQTAQFFHAFFQLPDATVRAWLADALPPAALVAAMARLFPQLSPKLRWKAASGGNFRHLVAAALASHP